MTNNSGNNQATKPDQARLDQVLAAYGANPARWPKDERMSLEEIAASVPGSGTINARQLDDLLDRLPAIEVPANISQKILTRAPKLPKTAGNRSKTVGEWLADLWSSAPIWRPAAAFAVLAFLGITLGVITIPPTNQSPGEIKTAQAPTVDPVTKVKLAAESNASDVETAWVVVFDQTTNYPGGLDNGLQIGFDPAGIELAGFVIEDM